MLNNIGFLYYNLFLYEKALKYYRRSLSIKKELGNVYILATAYNNIANLLGQMGYYNKALADFQKSLKYGSKTGTTYNRARTLNNIGLLHKKLGQNRAALAYYRKSLRLQKQFSNPKMLATTYSNIGKRLWDLGKKKKASNKLKKALALNIKTGAPRAIASSLLDLAQLELDRRDLPDFKNYLHRVKLITNKIPDPQLLKRQYMLQGRLDSLKDKPLLSIRYFKKAVHQASLISKVATVGPLEKLARVFYQNNKPQKAIHYGRKAIQIIEEERSHASSIIRFKSGYFKPYASFYVDMASWVFAYKHNIPLAYNL